MKMRLKNNTTCFAYHLSRKKMPLLSEGHKQWRRAETVSRVLSSGALKRRSNGHLSGTRVTAGLEQPTPSRPFGHAGPAIDCLVESRSEVLGLAPHGVCRAACVAADAVSSYLAFSPLPDLRRAVCFLWHCPPPPSPDISAGPRRYLACRPLEPGLSSPISRSGRPFLR